MAVVRLDPRRSDESDDEYEARVAAYQAQVAEHERAQAKIRERITQHHSNPAKQGPWQP